MPAPDAIDLRELLSRPRVRGHYNPIQKRKRNQHAGYCGRCGGRVPVEFGTLEEIAGRWRVVHLDGECKPVAPS
jgi:hypothetical protein